MRASAVLLSLQMCSALLMGPAVTPRAAATPRASVKMVWHVFPRDGASGMIKTEYFVERGMQQSLGRYDMAEYEGQLMHVDPCQCTVVAAEDGSCLYVYAQGTSPTGWRTSPYEPWNWMQPGESVALENGHKVSLDCTYPENAVFKFERSNWGNDYGQQGSGMLGQSAGALPPQQGYGGQQPGGQLPFGWTSGVDQQSGQTYYYNEQTGQSQWEPPR